MDIVYIIGMLAAFLLGAHIRKPFVFGSPGRSKEAQQDVCTKQNDTDYQKSLANLLAYDGTKQEEYDED